MKVIADIFYGYSFTPEGADMNKPVKGLLDGCRICGGGYYRPKIYDTIPSYLVKGAEYFGVIAPRTVSHIGQPQRVLNELGLTLDLATFEIVKYEELTEPVKVDINDMVMICNYIPQLFAPFGTYSAVVTGVIGDFDTTRALWSGSLEIGDLDANS